VNVTPTPGKRSLLWRGATRGCAVCGRRHLTTRWLDFPLDCPRCGFTFERQPGHFIGAIGVNTVVTMFLILVTLLGGIALSWPDVRAVPMLTATLAVAILVPPLIHPTAKTVWIAVDLIFHPLQPGEALGGPEESPAQQR